MHERPPCVHHHICHSPTPGVFGMDGFDICIFDGSGNGELILHTNTTILHMEVFPVAVDVWTYLAAAVVVPGIDTVPNVFEYVIFR